MSRERGVLVMDIALVRISKRATKSLKHSLVWESEHGDVESVKGRRQSAPI